MSATASQAPHQLHFYTTPTGGRFILSEAVVAIITGPVGESKTWSAIQRWFYKAQRGRACVAIAYFSLHPGGLRAKLNNEPERKSRIITESFR